MSQIGDDPGAATSGGTVDAGVGDGGPCLGVVPLLEYLAGLEPGERGRFAPSAYGGMNPDRVMPQIASAGVELVDINEAGPLKFSRSDIRAQLEAKRGKAFTALAHVGYVFGHRVLRKRGFTVSCDQGKTVADVAQWYHLVFVEEHGTPVLERIEYVHSEAE